MQDENFIPTRPFGSTGLRVSVLGYGGASIGFSPQQDEAGFVALVRQAFEAGINFFDTAPDYRHSEALIGRALQGCRDKVVLATKCGRLQFLKNGRWEIQEDWTAEGVRQTIEESLRRLRTDYLDLVQLHSPPAWVLERGEALQALQAARQAGKIRFIGLSADGEVARQAVEMGVFATLQISYSILEQEPGETILPAAARQGMGLIIKQPVANALGLAEQPPERSDWLPRWELARRIDWKESGVNTRQEWLELALRWVLSNPLVSTAIAGTTTPEHLKDNLRAATRPLLAPDELEVIRALYLKART